MNLNQYYYQSVPNQARYSAQEPASPYNNNYMKGKHQNVQSSVKHDSQFFSTLSHYTPLCYSGRRSPFFMSNKGWWLSLGCIMIMNALFLLVILFFLKQAGQGLKPLSDQNIRKYSIVNISLMIIMNIAYFLTQFLNPGVVNLASISQQQYEKDGKAYCEDCHGYRTEKMEHCKDCQVCIYGLDHHCGFFSKCIGGYQKFAFYGFLCIAFLGFFSLIITMTVNIGL